MSNKQAGNRYYDAGLVIQAKPEIDTNEFGLMEGTFTFLTAISNWPTIQPARATSCSSFTYGDSATHTFLTGVSFLACQTARWKPARLSDIACPGTLEILCQGARFQAGNEYHAIESIHIANRGGGYTSPPSIVTAAGGMVEPASFVTNLRVATQANINNGTAYVVGDVLTATGGIYTRPIKVQVDTVSGGVITLTHLLDRGKYSVVPANPVSFTGGTGTGSTVNFTWQLGEIIVIDGGQYSGTPTATATGGSPTTPAVLDNITMGDVVGSGSGITDPFKPMSLTKDEVSFTIFEGTATTDPAPSPTDLQARLVCVTDLPGPYTVVAGQMRGSNNLVDIDGRTPSVGDKILLTAMPNAAYNGLWVLTTLSSGTPQPLGYAFTMERDSSMDSAAQVTSNVYVFVSDGATNANSRWHCTTTSITTIDVNPIAFAAVAATTTNNAASLQVTIKYQAIDLHYEYVSSDRLARPRFIQNEYSIDANSHLIITDPSTDEKTAMPIDSVVAQRAITDTTTTGVTFSSDSVSISESDWRPHVRYIGTASRFEQTPVGACWHVLETTTIKIEPIVQPAQ